MKVLALLVWLALTCVLAQAGASVTISLRQAARVTGPMVTLGDVALLASSELEPLRMLVNLPIGRAPAAGETLVVQREALAPWILAKTGLASESLQWTGPAVTQLVATARRVSGEEIGAAAEVALRSWLSGRVRGGEVQLQVPPRDLDAPDGELQLRARALDGAALHSRMVVWLEVWVDQRFIRAVAVPFQVDAQQLLPTALSDRSAGNAATAKPIVVRGEWAALRSGSGAISLEARVEVLQDGRMGDSVRVRQPGAAGGVIARVTGPGQLELVR